MSWMQNEITMEHQATPYRDNEMIGPFLMRPKGQNSQWKFFYCISILGNSSGANKIYPVREKDFVDWEQYSTHDVEI